MLGSLYCSFAWYLSTWTDEFVDNYLFFFFSVRIQNCNTYDTDWQCDEGNKYLLSEMVKAFDSLEPKHLIRVLCPVPEAKSNLPIFP